MATSYVRHVRSCLVGGRSTAVRHQASTTSNVNVISGGININSSGNSGINITAASYGVKHQHPNAS